MNARAKIYGAFIALIFSIVILAHPAFAQEARLVIRTSPEGAAVKIDGNILNKKSPLTVSLSPGKHRVSAVLPGYRVTTRSLSVYPGINHLHLSLKSKAVAQKRTSHAHSFPTHAIKSSKKIAEKKSRAEVPPVKIEKFRADEHHHTASILLPVPEDIPSSAWPESAEEKMFKQTLDIPRFPEKLNVLLLGLDRRDRRGIFATGREISPERLKRMRARSDTIIMAQLDLNEMKVRVVSIPRDTRVFLSRRSGFGKINEAYVKGRVPFTKKVVSRLLDVPIHRHVVLDYRSMKTLIKIYHSLGFSFNGYDDRELFWYLRKRSFRTGDLRRIERQQNFVRASSSDYLIFANQMNEQQGLLGWAERTLFDTVINQALEYVDTDFSAKEARCLTYMFRNYDVDDITFATVPGRVKGKRYGEDDEKYISYFIPRRNHSFDQIIEAAERKRVSRSR